MSNMETIKCLIVDDESLARKVVENYLKDIPFAEMTAQAKNPMEAMTILSEQKIDLMFLDINMPKMSGMSFLKTLKHAPYVIMTTAYREYALESYEYEVIDYLHKPFAFDRFFTAVSKVHERMQQAQSSPIQDYLIPEKTREQIDENFIFVKSDKVTYKVNFKDILFIESVGDYVKIFTDDKVILTYQSLKKLEEILATRHFPRVHKSFIVAISKINAIKGNEIVIGKHEIPIGRSYRAEFFELVESYS